MVHKTMLEILRADTGAAPWPELPEIVWARLLDLAALHRVPTLVAWRITADMKLPVPEAIRKRCDNLLRKGTWLNFISLSKADRIGTLLAKEDIRSVLLKGPSLSRMAYQAQELRIFRDLDILVSRADIHRARRILLAHGFRSTMDPENEQHYLQNHFHIIFTDESGTVVELHWDLVRPQSLYAFSGEGVIERSRPHGDHPSTNDEAAEDQVLHAVVQSISEGFSSLVRVCDLDTLIRLRNTSLDWDGISRRARNGNLAFPLAFLFRLSSQLLATPVPREAILAPPSRIALTALNALQPAEFLLTRSTKRVKGYTHLLRFWLFPGQRLAVLWQMLRGHPRDRTRPAPQRALSRTERWRLILLRCVLLLRLVAIQIAAIIRVPMNSLRGT